MKGEIEILPSYVNGYSSINPFWDVEIPNTIAGGNDNEASGGEDYIGGGFQNTSSIEMLIRNSTHI